MPQSVGIEIGMNYARVLATPTPTAKPERSNHPRVVKKRNRRDNSRPFLLAVHAPETLPTCLLKAIRQRNYTSGSASKSLEKKKQNFT